nr:ribonuclease H-like domain, reverse transcriptase, RNA-dependent DNA polymerase [Tanacetum cinerariifolium]
MPCEDLSKEISSSILLLLCNNDSLLQDLLEFLTFEALWIETTEEGTKILATVDGQFSHQWKYLIHTIMQCMSQKSTGFNEFSSKIATALVCLATNRVYNFSKMIFDGMVRNVKNKLDELTALCTSLQRQHSEMVSRFEAQELEINSLKARIKLLEDKDRGVTDQSRDDAPIKGRRLDEGEEAAKRVSNDTEEMINVLTSMDAATILSSRVAEVPTGSGSIPTAGPPATGVPTGSDVVPTAGLIFATATMVTPYTRRKGKEKMIEDAEIARIHAEEELQIMINSLDRSNETVVKYLQEYEQILEDLSIRERIELISDLIKYQENYAQVLKYQTLQRKPRSKKQKKDYYMTVIKGHSGWKTKDFKGISFKQIEAMFNTVWKQIEDFIQMGSKEEVKRLKRKGLRLEQESVKKLKIPEEVPKEVKSSEEVPEEKVKEMMQLVPIEEVYVESLQVKPLSLTGKFTQKDKEVIGRLQGWEAAQPATNS